MSQQLDRARGSLAGLAIGDALGRPVEGMSYQDIRAKYGEIADFVNLEPAGSDDTEYALLTAAALLQYGINITADDFANIWKSKVCTQTAAFMGAGFSEMNAIQNLKIGLMPPYSGQHNHAWSDGLAMRVAPIGVFANGDIEVAKRIAIADGEVSHSGEGIHAGIAIAVAVTSGMAGKDYLEVFSDAVSSIPKNSWTYRTLIDAQNSLLENSNESLFNNTERLLNKVAQTKYFFADLAPEAVSLALASVLWGKGDFAKTLLFAVNLGRDADTIAAMAGAVAGAISGYEKIPDKWKVAVTSVGGSCLEFTKGMEPLNVADSLVEMSKK